ncbi:Fe-S cluster assembly sulfur transfer protein SufU [Lichenicoccus sp.]|uniref:Fe-S cluster assembly sulfur transfer protein SufU n=1 Tax=Lichenicoccus sp. TaxID=2781899 RepID=UPI003D135E8F
MDGSEREALYQDLIMERTRAPRHAGVVEPADGAADGNNPFCGDAVHVTVARAQGGRVMQVRHRTRGCAICMASADLMAETVQDLDEPAICSLFERFDAMLREGPAESPRADDERALGLLRAFEALHEYRSRIRCATLPWAALLDALKCERTA